MLWRAAGEPAVEGVVNPFTDVKESDFFYTAVLWAVQNGITNGISATEFDPFGETNRAQAVTFLWRWMGQVKTNNGNSFTDVQEGQWYTDAINWAVNCGITNGQTATEFGIEAVCNRAHMVTFLYRADMIETYAFVLQTNDADAVMGTVAMEAAGPFRSGAAH